MFDIYLSQEENIRALPEIELNQLDNPEWAKVDQESDTPSYFKKQLNLLSLGDSFKLGESFRNTDKKFSFDDSVPSPQSESIRTHSNLKSSQKSLLDIDNLFVTKMET